MSLLRKKYYSIQSQTFVDVSTDSNNTINSADVGSVYNNETIRLIQFGSNIESGKMDELVSDLVYNDKLLFSHFQKINSLLSNGSFYSVGDNFQVYDVKKTDYLDGTYIQSFGIKSGQIKYNDEIIFLEPQQNYKVAESSVSGANYITLNNNFNLSEGSIIFGSEFESGTQITGITGTTVELSKNLTSDLASGSLVLFMDIPTFEVGKEIDEIGSYDIYPVYRRDLITYDLNTSSWEVTKGPELLTKPALNTQLDVTYKIESIIYQSSNLHKVKLIKNNRTITTDFSVGDFITLFKTNNNVFDGSYEIISIDSINNSLVIRVPLFRNSSKNQSEIGGFIDLRKIGVISLLVYKTSDTSPSLIIDSFENILNYSGITGGVQNIIRAEILPDNNYYSIKTNDYIHLTDINGRLLDWEDGQDIESGSELGYHYNENELQIYDDFQIPFPDYANIESGYLTNIPFILTTIDNNVFGFDSVDIVSLNIAIKNNSINIGAEGIEYRIVSYPQITDEITIYNSSVQRNANNKIIKTIINNPTINFSNLSVNLVRKDFILITEGAGAYQIGKITTVANGYIEVIGLFKELDSTSKFIIFENTISVLSNSENIVYSDDIRSQVLSGVNGTLGPINIYSKVQLPYTTSIPKITIKQWYFVNIKGYSDDINQNGTSYILVESPSNSSVKNSSAFVEIFYRTVSGVYPNGNLLIEDEFGDLFIEFTARTESPHFRPSKYKMIARSLDQLIEYPQNVDEVFIDVHIGKIKFHKDGKPRRLYVSYNKFDVIDGNSTDFSIKHIDINDTLKTNVQDKISEIDSRFKHETKLEKTWTINGLISDENTGFIGPFDVDINNPYNIIYKDANFNNFSYDEDNNIVKLSNHQYDSPAYVGENNVILNDLKLELTNTDNNFVSSTLISSLDFLDYEYGVSGDTLPETGINFFDESFFPVSDRFYNLDFLFYRKKLLFDTPNYKSTMLVDSGLYNPDFGLDSTWNYLYASEFGKNLVLYGLLRKSNYEDLTINANNNIKRRFRQREFIRLLDRNLNDINSQKSSTKIISEKFLSQSLILDSLKYKENYLFLKTEITKYKDYKFLLAQDIDGNSLGLSNNSHSINGTFNSTFKRSNIFINNLLITGFLNPNDSNKPYFKIITFSKTEETSDIGSTSFIGNNIAIDSDNSAIDIKICQFNDNYFAVGYVYQYLSIFYLKIKVYDLDGNYQTGSEKLISSISSPFYFTIEPISANKIGIVFQKTEIQSGLTIYYFANQYGSSVNDIKIIENQYPLLDYPTICKFLPEYFLVGYSNSLGAKIKIFNSDGILQFFDNNKSIDYRTVTNKVIAVKGNLIKLLELNNNDIAIVYLDRKENETYNLKLIILDSWTKNWKYTSGSLNTSTSLSDSIIIETDLTDLINSVSLCNLNEDIFTVSYIKNNKINLKAYKNDGGELFTSFEDLTPGLSNIILNNVGQSTVIATYIDNINSDYRYSVYNFRPDFIINSSSNKPFEINTYNSNYYFKMFNYDYSNFISLVQKTSTDIEIKLVSTNIKEKHYLNPNISSLTITLTNLTKILDTEFITYFVDQTKINVLLILWSDGTSIFVKFVKFTISAILDAGSLTVDTTFATYSKTFGQLISLSSKIIGIILKTSANKYNIHGINLSVFDSNNIFGTVNQVKYTNSSNNIYNPVSNVLSGVNAEYDVSFFNRNKTFGYLIYPQNNKTVMNTINLTSSFIVNGAINLSNISFENSSVINSTRQFSSINLTVDNTDNNKVFLIGNTSGTGIFYKLTYNENNEYDYIKDSGSFTSIGSTLNDSPNIFNTSDDQNVLIVHNESATGTNSVKVQFMDKDNFIQTEVNPVSSILFNETPKDNRILSFKSSSNDIYLVYPSNGSLISKTYSSIFGDSIKEETIILEDDKTGTSTNRNRLYLENSLKIGGINWRGDVIKTYPVFAIPSLNLDSSMIDDDNVFRSEMMDISAHLVYTSKDSITVIYHYHKNKSSEIKIKLRNYAIYRGRLFPTTSWYDGLNELSFEGLKKKIYLECIQYPEENILYVWCDPQNQKIKKAIVNKYNQSAYETYEEIIQPNNNSKWILLGSSILIENWSTVIAYDLINKQLYTLLFNPLGQLHRFGNSFTLPFSIETTLRSKITINKYGYFTWLYMDSSQNLKYYQHGFDGDPWGVAQIVGKNYLSHIETTANSSIENTILNSPDINFLKYNRIDYTINNNEAKTISDIFAVQETAQYRIFCLTNPTINIVLGLKNVQNQEPLVSVDTSSLLISNVPDTSNKFNIYILNNNLVFQNKTGDSLKFRFYKEN